MLSLTSIIVVSLVVSMVEAQSFVDVEAAAVTPKGAAAASAQAIGATAAGTVVADVTPTTSFASATAIATGPVAKVHAPVAKVHAPVTKVHPSVVYPKHHPVPAPVKKAVVAPKCGDIKDCYKIDSVSYCGYCIAEKYPTKGKGCTYEPIYEKGDKKKATIIGYTPKCECKGTFIHDKAACPSCESVLAELLACAGKKDVKGEVEIPASCIDKIKVSVEYLGKCGLYKTPAPTKKVVVTPAPAKKHPITVVAKPPQIGKKHHPATVSSASASATAVATGGAAFANANAIAFSG
eukprot:TRINITY_DN123_c1_g1_i1.p1 TRINITY_DN123_c1_g1~~TRINITY_DN123_c1_g1_i1.p1  ORF type:complete len:293 (-),score=44.14 TRINITY_DN123_c1_g1_i1:1035-1913(-)